jgi:hypothetical protein
LGAEHGTQVLNAQAEGSVCLNRLKAKGTSIGWSEKAGGESQRHTEEGCLVLSIGVMKFKGAIQSYNHDFSNAGSQIGPDQPIS